MLGIRRFTSSLSFSKYSNGFLSTLRLSTLLIDAS